MIYRVDEPKPKKSSGTPRWVWALLIIPVILIGVIINDKVQSERETQQIQEYYDCLNRQIESMDSAQTYAQTQAACEDKRP